MKYAIDKASRRKLPPFIRLNRKNPHYKHGLGHTSTLVDFPADRHPGFRNMSEEEIFREFEKTQHSLTKKAGVIL